MTGTILQLNISPGGLPKYAVSEAFVHPLGVEGDSHLHPQFHGGPRKALLLVTTGAIAELVALGYPLFPGAMGENLTVEGIPRSHLRIGQRFRAGGVIMELTQLRKPCSALDVYGPGIRQAVFDDRAKRGDTTSPCWGLGGFYASVLQPGPLKPGDTIALVEELV